MTAERMGIPSVAVATDLFGGTARNEAELYGLLALPIAIVAHPVAGSTRASVEERAAWAAGEIAISLTASAAALAAYYTGRVARAGAGPNGLASLGVAEGAACVECLVE